MYQSYAKRLREIAQSIMASEADKASAQEDIASYYEDAKNSGFDTKALKAAIKASKRSASERKAEQDTIDLYLAAIDDQMDLFAEEPTVSLVDEVVEVVAKTVGKGLRRKGEPAEMTH